MKFARIRGSVSDVRPAAWGETAGAIKRRMKAYRDGDGAFYPALEPTSFGVGAPAQAQAPRSLAVVGS
jgi:hypothetical protein